MTTGINIKNKKKYALNSFAKQNRTISITLILKVSVIQKNSGKRSSLISVTRDSIPIHAFFYKQNFYKQHQAEIGKTLSKS